MKKEDADQDGAGCADPRPDGISRADGQGLRCFGEKTHAENCKKNKPAYPTPPFFSAYGFGASEAVCKAYFAETCNGQENPSHCLNDFRFTGLESTDRKTLCIYSKD